MDSESARSEALRTLVELGAGIFDSFPDAAVGHILQPKLTDRIWTSVPVSTNRFGLRERDYALPKPPRVTRVVILGDSYVFGTGVRAEDRCGVFLERFLQGGVSSATVIECLHMAVPSWNIVAECQYLRRQLTLLSPDLVIQVVVPNDLDDSTGIRGFGSLARHVPDHPQQADTVIQVDHARAFLQADGHSYLLQGYDYEGRSRYVQASDGIMRLAGDIQRNGGRYLLVVHGLYFHPFLYDLLAPDLDRRMVVGVPAALYTETRYCVSDSDRHWNALGHQYIATFLYGVIRSRNLLVGQDLQPWPQADTLVAAIETELNTLSKGLRAREDWQPVFSTIDLDHLEVPALRQIHGGIDREGLVSPYASVILVVGPARELVVHGQHLESPTLAGSAIDVFVDEVLAASIPIQPAQPFHVRVPLSKDVAQRKFVSVRFVASDFVYDGADLRHCVAFKLISVGIE